MRRAKKKYGQSKTIYCPFCNRVATQKTEEGIEVCHRHLKSKMQEIRCTCGSWLEQRSGKFGPYFNCINCGNINFQKGLDIIKMRETAFLGCRNSDKAISCMKDMTAPISEEIPEKPKEVKKKKEITISTDDVEYFS